MPLPPPRAAPRPVSAFLHGRDSAVGLGPAIAVELPRVSHLLDQAEIEIGDDEFVLIAAADREDLPSRIAEVTLAIELADVPRRFDADAVDRANEISVRHRVCRLFELPQVFGEAGDGCRRIQYDLGAVETKNARPFGK